ncbi:predicted ORF [Xanthomonas phage XacN1]|nr:predicted ORF [Xanthomonas phage XacN1]
MTEAEQHGYLTGVSDLSSARWDGDNVIPPSEYMHHSREWYTGYNKAYQDRIGRHAYQSFAED